MESTDATIMPASHTGILHMAHGNRLHVRVSVRGSDLELTDERADNEAASVNVQDLISAFAGVMKTNVNTTSLNTGLIAGNAEDSGFVKNSKDFKAEIVRLRQSIQKFEGEIMHLRQLLQESKKENEELKIRFRSATHMKAAEIAQQLSQVDAAESATDSLGSEGLIDFVEPYTPEQEHKEAILNPQVKNIDFLSLDEILGHDDAVEVISKRTAKDVIEEDHNAVMDNSGSGSRTIFGDDEKHLDGSKTKMFASAQATPPSVLKIGLDPDLARAGGECKVKISHGSPLRPRRRGRINNYDSPAEQDSAMQTDEDLAGPGDRSMVGTYGITYRPSPDDGSCHKTVLIGNLPQDIDYRKLLAKVRGGYIISATLCDTTKLRGCGGRMSALVVFINAESARAYVTFANKHGICFDSQKAVVRLVDTPTYPLSLPAQRRIGYGQTRYLVIPKFRSELSLARIDRVINSGVNKYRVDAMERFWKDEEGTVRIRFASINATGMAYWRLDTDPNYNRLNIRFEEDPCGRPLSDLLPTPKGRRFSNFIDTKVNYDDEDDSEDNVNKHLKPVNPSTDSSLNNVDEIVIEADDEDTVDDTTTEGRTTDDQMANEKPRADIDATAIIEVKAMDDGNVLIISDEAKAADVAIVANEKPAKAENCRETRDFKTSDISKAELLLSTVDVPKPENVSNVESSSIVEDFTTLESVTFSPTISQPSDSVFDQQPTIAAMIPSSVNGVMESWAEDVNGAIKSGMLEPPVELKVELPHATLIDTDGETAYPAFNLLPTIPEEDPFLGEPVEQEPIPDTLTEVPDARSPTMELSVTKAVAVEDPITAMCTKQPVTTRLPTRPLLAISSLVEAIKTPVVKLPSSTPTTASDKFDLTGTDLDPALLARHVLEKVLSEKPRGGLSTSRWADPETKSSTPIIIQAPLAVPVLGAIEKDASELLFGKSLAVTTTSAPQPVSLAPPNAPKGPRACGPGSRFMTPENRHKTLVKDQLHGIQNDFSKPAANASERIETRAAPVQRPFPTGPNYLSRKPQIGPSHSRYSSLDLDAVRPRSSLRNFYTAIDSRSATAPKKLGAAVPDVAMSGTGGPGPSASSAAKPVPATPEPDQRSRPRGEAGAESGAEGLNSGVEAQIRGPATIAA